MKMRPGERGLSNSVQVAVLLPFSFAVLLAVLQWAMVSWAEATALSAAQHGAAVAAALDGSAAAGEAAATGAARTAALQSVSVTVERGGATTTATVSGRALVVVWPRDVTRTVVVPTERLS